MLEQAQGRIPPAELIRGLAVFAEPPTEEHRLLAEALDLPGVPTPAEYADLFLFQLYPYASVHLGPEGMLGGEARARVAGFWRALGYDPPSEPDHLAALLGLYAALADRESAGAAAVAARNREASAPETPATERPEATTASAEARLIGESRTALLHEHIAPWVFPFLARVGELAGGPYAAWAECLEAVLREEVEAGAYRSLPLHLRDAPALPDPRVDGASDFFAGLLAPVRAGFVLTRADLAAIAARCDVGLRAGERRYALEHLVAQDGSSVLSALAEEARRQADGHEARAAWLGVSAAFFAERARTTAGLLGALADQAGAEESRLAGPGAAGASVDATGAGRAGTS